MTPRVYRFALYGRAGAGKTSLLAAMALPHATRDGVACTWRGAAADVPRPAGPEEGWAADDPTAAAYRGAEWLREAMRAIDAGGVPPPNPNDAHPLRFRFDLKDGGVAYPVEVIDYSGELIDPAASATDLAARLRDHLRACDGLLVLAEAPRPGPAPTDLVGELHRLQQGFAVLGGTRAAEGSIALVVNKWDRRGADADPAAVDAFLASPEGRSHRGLADALRTAVPDGFRAFAASAFGRVRADAEGERPPAERPLSSFGLEEPFLWAARRHLAREADAAVERLRELARSPWWRVDRLVRGRRRAVAGAAADLRAAFPPDFPHAAAADRIAAATAGAWRPQVAVLLLLAVVLWGTATGLVDRARYVRHRPALTDGRLEDLDAGVAARDWLANDYLDRSFFRSPFSRLVLRNEAARETLVALEDRLSRRRAERDERDRQRAENDRALDGWRDRATSLAGLADVAESWAKTASLPRPDAASDDQRQAFRAFRDRLGGTFDARKRAAGVSDLEGAYADAVRNRDLVGAANLVERFPDERKAEAKRKFAETAVALADEERGRGVRDRDWVRARAFVAKLAGDDAVRRSLTATQEGKLAGLLKELEDGHDADLYEQVKRDRTAAAARRYLAESPGTDPGRRNDVEAFKDATDRTGGELDVTVALTRIDWGEEGWASVTNAVEVWVNGNANRSVATDDVPSAKGTATPDIGQFPFKGKLDDPLEIRIKVKAVTGNFITTTRSQGEGTLKTTIRELIAGKELDLQRLGNKAQFKIAAGVPEIPALK